MDIPNPYLFNIETPTLLFKEHLFQLGDETNTNSNYLEIASKKFNLAEIAQPKILEELYFENNKELFEQYKQNFISTSMHQMYLSAENIDSELRNNKTLNLIVNDILPVITAVRIDNQLEAALTDKTYSSNEDLKDIFSSIHRAPGRLRTNTNSELADKTKDEFIKKVEAEYSGVGIAKPKNSTIDNYIFRELTNANNNRDASLVSVPSILTDELLGGTNLFFIENRAYDLYTVPKLMLEFRDKISDRYLRELSGLSADVDPTIVVDSVKRNYNQIDASSVSRIVNKLKSTKFNIDGNFYFPLYFNESTGILTDYKKLVEKRLKIDSVNHVSFQAESLRKIEEEKSRLSRLVSADKFEINGAGFEKRNGSYYVFITTPKYVLRSPHNQHYYKFDGAKIGVEVSIRGANSLEIGEPLVMNSYRHPFLRGSGEYQKICLGQYRTDSARRLPPAQAVLTILTKAQENIMMGYKTGGNPHNRLDDDKFSAYGITQQAFEKSGLACLNDYRR